MATKEQYIGLPPVQEQQNTLHSYLYAFIEAEINKLMVQIKSSNILATFKKCPITISIAIDSLGY